MADAGTKSCPMCGESVKAEALLCRFCKHDFRGPGPGAAAVASPPRSNSILILAAVAAVILPVIAMIAIVAAIAIPGLLAAQRASNERRAGAMLRQIAAAQEEFRASDCDRNGVADYWTADVYGLYGLRPSLEERHIELIDEVLATSDGASSRLLYIHAARGPRADGPHPHAGFVFRAFGTRGEERLRMDTDGLGTLYPPVHHESRYAIAALPEKLSRGKSAFVVTEDGVLWAFRLDPEYRLTYTRMTATTDSSSATQGAFGFAGPHTGDCPADPAAAGARRLP